MLEESIFEIQAALCRTMSNAIRLEILRVRVLMREVLVEGSALRSKLIKGFQGEQNG
jgi:hypothetical protein